MRACILATAAVVVSGCGQTPDVPLPIASEAQAFQVAYEDELRTRDTSALRAVASFYVAPGDVLDLGPDGSRIDSSDGPPAMRFAFESGAFACVLGCAGHRGRVEGRMSFELGRSSAVASSQAGPGRVMIFDPSSPALAEFEGLQWFPVDERFIVPARFKPSPKGTSETLTTSRGLTKDLSEHGRFDFELDGHSSSLVGYAMGENESSATQVLIPFADASNGETSYPQGRYLSVEVPDGADAVPLDFNRATNPLCAYSEHFNCPIPPTRNRLPVEVRAGERYEH